MGRPASVMRTFESDVGAGLFATTAPLWDRSARPAAGGAPASRPPAAVPPARVTPEFRLLCAALAWPRDEETRGRLRACADRSLDWTQVLALADRHRVAGLLASALEDAEVEPPADVRETLARRSRELAFEELVHAAELSRLRSEFRAEGLEFTVLKGLSVALQGFGRIGLRQNRDLDLLVGRDRLEASARVLERLGYERVEPPASASAGQVEQWIRQHKDIAYRRSDTGVIVELHTRLYDNTRLSERLVGVAAGSIRLPTGVEVPTLPVPEAVLYMCVHGSQHAWSRLKWLADLAAMASRLTAAERVQLYAEARARGLARAVAQAFALQEALLGRPAPGPVRAAYAGDWRVRALVGIALRAAAGSAEVEIEDEAFGSTLKTLSHYLLRTSLRYWFEQALYDLHDLPAEHRGAAFAPLAPLLKLPLWIVRVGSRLLGRLRVRRRTRL